MQRGRFPHAKTCGPIEAPRARAPSRRASHFRTQKRAAPLKRLDPARKRYGKPRFPHAKTCGPIEAFLLVVLRAPARDFRTQKRAAPLKPKHRLCFVRG